MQHMYSLGQVAHNLGIAAYRISYAISVGRVPDASTRFAGKRVFKNEDVQRLEQHFRTETRSSPTDDNQIEPG